eukprot:sb/3476035/
MFVPRLLLLLVCLIMLVGSERVIETVWPTTPGTTKAVTTEAKETTPPVNTPTAGQGRFSDDVNQGGGSERDDSLYNNGGEEEADREESKSAGKNGASSSGLWSGFTVITMLVVAKVLAYK